MTDKRFTVIDREEPRKQSVAEEGIPCTARHCCTRLNGLTEENKQLKQSFKEILKDLEVSTFNKELIEKENEQLKQELAIYRKLASCSNCKYHNYDWYDDGDEFEVCDKGNDVTEGICKGWRKL